MEDQPRQTEAEAELQTLAEMRLYPAAFEAALKLLSNDNNQGENDA